MLPWGSSCASRRGSPSTSPASALLAMDGRGLADASASGLRRGGWSAFVAELGDFSGRRVAGFSMGGGIVLELARRRGSISSAVAISSHRVSGRRASAPWCQSSLRRVRATSAIGDGPGPSLEAIVGSFRRPHRYR